MRGFASVNYKDGRYVFSMFNRRDFAFLTILAIIFLLIVWFIVPNTEDPLGIFTSMVVIYVCIFFFFMPLTNYQSVYTYLYYQLKHWTSPRVYKWKGIEYDFSVEEENEE